MIVFPILVIGYLVTHDMWTLLIAWVAAASGMVWWDLNRLDEG